LFAEWLRSGAVEKSTDEDSGNEELSAEEAGMSLPQSKLGNLLADFGPASQQISAAATTFLDAISAGSVAEVIAQLSRDRSLANSKVWRVHNSCSFLRLREILRFFYLKEDPCA
jgi:hypothetical protein